jgi:hypothetical protein
MWNTASPRYPRNPPGRLFARLARLNIAQSAATHVENLLDEQPTTLPALDIVVDDFELRGKKLGRVEIEAQNRGGEGAQREWRLNKFNITAPEASFTATGNWAAAQAVPGWAAPCAAAERRTVMNFKLDIRDSGDLLARFGMENVVRRGKGRMEGQVAWIGAPLSHGLPLHGRADQSQHRIGQFLKADPGLAKLLGVLSLQSLPRRLTLDFRDVFSEGFAFDFVRGDVRIEQGVASTNNLQMKGVNAAVLMEGSADIDQETQDLQCGGGARDQRHDGLAGGHGHQPGVGLGSFLAQVFLRGPLIEAATQEFHIDGTWADPRVVRVPRRGREGSGRQACPRGHAPRSKPPRLSAPESPHESRSDPDGVWHRPAGRTWPLPTRCWSRRRRGGAELAVLPEYFCADGLQGHRQARLRETYGEGVVQRFLARAARELNLWVVGGTLPLRPLIRRRVRNTTWCIARRATAWPATTRSTSSGLTTGASSTTKAA